MVATTEPSIEGTPVETVEPTVDQTRPPRTHRTRRTQKPTPTPSVADVISTATGTPEKATPTAVAVIGPPGSIKVLIPTAHAYVWINGEYLDDTINPAKSFEDIPPGEHEVVLYHNGWDGRVTRKVKVQSGQQARVEWRPKRGWVKLEYKEPLEIYGKGPSPLPFKKLGSTDKALELTQGKHTVYLKKPNCKYRRFEFEVGSQNRVVEIPRYDC